MENDFKKKVQAWAEELIKDSGQFRDRLRNVQNYIEQIDASNIMLTREQHRYLDLAMKYLKEMLDMNIKELK